MIDLLTAVPFAVVSAVVTWSAQTWSYAHKRKGELVDSSDKLIIHRDQLTLDVLRSAQTELSLVREELGDLREEQGTLRKLEQHVYHFQESLDHLESVLFATTEEEVTQARRNATAFLRRMRRLQAAKGTILNEVQIRKSEQRLSGGEGQDNG